MTYKLALALILISSSSPGVLAQEAVSESKPLVVIDASFDISATKTRDATASLVDVEGGKGVKVVFPASDKYPDIQFSSAEGRWDLSAFGGVRATITNAGTASAKVGIRVDNPGKPTEKKWNMGGDEIGAGETKVVEVMFGQAKGKNPVYPLDPKNVSAFHVFVTKPGKESTFVIRSIEAFGKPAGKPAAVEADEGPAAATGRRSAPKTKPSAPLLFGFDAPDVVSRIIGLDTKFQVGDADGKKVLRVEMGSSKPYPNVTFKPPEGSWNLDPFTRVEMEITNTSDESIQVAGRVDNPGATGKSNSNGGKISLDPGGTGTLVVDFDRYFAEALRQKLEGMRQTPWGARGEWGSMLDPADVVQVSLFANKPARPFSFTVHSIKAAGSFDPAAQVIPEPFFPFVDKFGQYIHKDWLNKVKTEGDLASKKAEEMASIDAHPRPSNWNVFGGWADGPQLKKTGHFYTTKQNGKWFLVDPDGRLFFSLGIDVVQPGGATPIDKRDGWFADAPWEKEEGLKGHMGTAKGVKHGEYKDTTPRTFNFFTANLQRKYGAAWEQTWRELMPQRLMNWGFNTIGNWSDPKINAMGKIPYTHWVFHFAKKLPWQANTRNPIPDPFADTFEEEIRKGAVKMTKGTVDDPFCIGYFVDNELSWRDEDFQGKAAMQGNAANPAKVELLKDLEAKYGGIEKLNSAWKTSFASWAAMMDDKTLPETDAGREDLKRFSAKVARKYFETVSRVMKEVAPNKLYLGCRFADHNPQVVKIAAEYCDVVSFNIYRETVAAWKPPVEFEKPVIIGEFHFGATDCGVFGSGLVKAKNAEDRAAKFYNYVTGAGKNPQLVGAHWFALIDEPTTGRTQDAENYNIGFLSVTDTPYQKMIEASRKAAQEIYQIRSK